MSGRGCFVVLLVLLAGTGTASGQTIGGRVMDRTTRSAAYPVSVRVLDDSGHVLTSTATDSTGVFYADLTAPAHVRLRFDLDGTRWVMTDTLTVGAGEFVQRQFRVPFIETFFEFQVETMVTQRPGTGRLHYPDHLRQKEVEGEVLAQFVVDTTGEAMPETFRVLRATHLDFVSAVRAGLVTMRFNPAEIHGVKVKQLVQQPFTFTLLRDAKSIERNPGEFTFPDLPRAGRHNP